MGLLEDGAGVGRRGLPALDRGVGDCVARLERIDGFHPLEDMPERGVAAIKVMGRAGGDEKLAASRVPPSERHPDNATVVGRGRVPQRCDQPASP